MFSFENFKCMWNVNVKSKARQQIYLYSNPYSGYCEGKKRIQEKKTQKCICFP